jgi:hypothetical protein
MRGLKPAASQDKNKIKNKNNPFQKEISNPILGFDC